MTAEIRTERLLMRRWRDEDRAPFAAMNADPVVMRYSPRTMSHEESDAFVDRIEARNEPSQRVMQRIGMRLHSRFEHVRVEPGDPLRPHVRYTADRETG